MGSKRSFPAVSRKLLVISILLLPLLSQTSIGAPNPKVRRVVRAQETLRLHLPLALARSGLDTIPAPSTRPAPAPTATPSPEPPAPLTVDGIGVYGLSSSYVMLRLGLAPDALSRRFHFGFAQTAFHRAMPVAGDWDGDGRDTIAIYDPRAARFTLTDRNVARAAETSFAFGEPTVATDDGTAVYALAGDWDGDGRDSIGLFSAPANVFRLRNENSAGPPDLVFAFGQGNRRPVVGDWDGDGIDTIGVLDPATGIAVLRNENAAGPPDLEVETGRARHLPLAGDWDGDGADTLGLWHPATMTFFLRDSHEPGSAERELPLGSRASAWWPLAGRWEASGDTGEHAGFAWPTAAPEAVGIDPAGLTRAYERAAAIENLHSLLVVRHGKLVGEAYYDGYDATMANCLKSVSKSILGALYGLAIEDGFVRGLEQPVSAHLPDYYANPAEPRLGRTSIYNLLTMTGGQPWSDPTHLGAMVGSEDWVGHVAGLPFTSNPGSRWNYNTGLTHVASAFLTEATGEATHAYAERRLFDPLGISVTRWDHDTQGRDFGGAEVWMRPRDMARFGELFLRGGTIDGTRILDERWVAASMRAQETASGGHTYGYWWWRRDFAGHPTTFAWGYGGQFIFVVEELDLVVVTTSSWFRGANATTNGPVFALLADYVLPAVVGD